MLPWPILAAGGLVLAWIVLSPAGPTGAPSQPQGLPPLPPPPAPAPSAQGDDTEPPFVSGF